MTKKRSTTLDTTRMTAPQLAQLLAMDRTTPHKWQSQGCPVNADGSFQLATVVKWRIAKADEKTPNCNGDNEHWLTEWRRARAEREQIALDKDRGMLVTLESATRVWSRHITEAAQLLSTLPGLLALIVPPELRRVVTEEATRVVDHVRHTLASGSDAVMNDSDKAAGAVATPASRSAADFTEERETDD